MTRNIALSLLAAVAFSGNALADDITIDPFPFVSSRTVAEVQAELAVFQKSGINPWSIRYNPLAAFKSTVSSQELAAAYLASRSEVAAFNGENSGSVYLAATRVQDAGATLAGRPHNEAR